MTTASVGFYRPELDVLRFLAFLLVFFSHGLENTQGILDSLRIPGACGVYLFFLLSSYLITELLEREKQQTGKIHLRAFYIRRTLRIWPLYLSFLLFDYLLQSQLNPGAFSSSRLVAFLLAVGNWYVAHHGFAYTLSLPLWSISVEEQFYLIWPSVRKYLGRSGSVVFSIAMFIVAYLALASFSNKGSHHSIAISVNSFVQFQFFSTGALLALTLRGRIPKFHATVRVILCLTGLASLIESQHLFKVQVNDSISYFHLLAPGYLFINLGCTLLLLSFLGASHIAQLKPFVYLGKISYGLYVFHWMMLRISFRLIPHLLGKHQVARTTAVALEVTLAFVLTVLLAALSYRFFEAPILGFKKRFEFIRTRAV